MTAATAGVSWSAWRIERGRHAASCVASRGGEVVGEVWRPAPDHPFSWAAGPVEAPATGESPTLRGAKAAVLAALAAQGAGS